MDKYRKVEVAANDARAAIRELLDKMSDGFDKIPYIEELLVTEYTISKIPGFVDCLRAFNLGTLGVRCDCPLFDKV